MDRSILSRKPMTELRDIASHLNMRGYNKLRKAELIDAIIDSGSGGEQQTLDAGTDEQAVEAGARKVLPPGDDAAPAEGASDRAADGAADRSEPQDGGRGGRSGGSQRSDGSGRSGGRDRSGRAGAREGGSAQRSADDESSGDQPADRSADRPDSGGGQDRDQGQDRGQDRGEQDQDQGEAGKRRSRRDRRKRNRDRSADDAPAQDAPSPSTGGGGGGGGQGDPGEVRAGVLDILPEGYGFLRTTGYLPGERDVYVSQGQIRKHGLRRGDVVQGPIRQQRSNEKVPALHHVQKVNGEGLEDGQVPSRPVFDELPITPEPARVALAAADSASTAVRMIDLLAPIGLGQRALVIAPPRAAKERLLREVADALVDATPDSHLMMVLLDERPEVVAQAVEEVDGEVIASTFEQTAEEHAQIAELAVERARRMVELGHDVIVVIDSLTRLARALGVTVQTNGRAIAPGVEAASLYPVKRMLAAARRIDGGGSLTLLGVALAGTGSALDEAILQEVGRTATTEIVLDDTLTRRRIWPSISVLESDARDEARLHDDDERAAVIKLRRALEGMDPADASALVVDKLVQTSDNDAFIAQLSTAPLVGADAGATPRSS